MCRGLIGVSNPYPTVPDHIPSRLVSVPPAPRGGVGNQHLRAAAQLQSSSSSLPPGAGVGKQHLRAGGQLAQPYSSRPSDEYGSFVGMSRDAMAGSTGS